jgi:hypothetical protein
MRLLTSAGIGVLALLLGVPALSAQDEAKPRPEEPRAEENEAKPQQNPADKDKQVMKQDENNHPKDDKASKEEKQEQKDDANAAKEAGKQGQMNQAQGNHAHPANGKSGRIPDKDFKAHFGRQHTVVINQPVIVEGQPRFQYSGYWFIISNPWPAGWAYTDSCYIDYIDGEYFLFDLLHPGVQVALVVVVG